MSPRLKMDRVRKAQIRAAAASLIGERGLNATRVEDVAARAGTSKAAVLYWFRGKDALLAEALALQDEVFYGELTQRMTSLDSAAQRLRLIGDTFLFRYEYRLWMELCVHALHDPAIAEVRRSFDQRWRELIAHAIVEGQERGEFEPGDAQLIAVELAALLDGLCIQITLGDPAVSAHHAVYIWKRAAEAWLGATLEPAREEAGRARPARAGSDERRGAADRAADLDVVAGELLMLDMPGTEIGRAADEDALLRQAVEYARALAHEARLWLIESLAKSEATVADLSSDLGLSKATVSRHLQTLYALGLADRRRVDSRLVYTLADRGTLRLLGTMAWLFRRRTSELPGPQPAELVDTRGGRMTAIHCGNPGQGITRKRA